MIRPVPNGFVVTTIPFFVFIALADKGMVDVVEIDTGRVIRRIPAPGVSVLSSYFKQ